MVYYNPKLKSNARALRSNMAEAEKLIWSRLRNKQINNIQFYRQRSIASFIVDFYAPKVQLVVEIDGSQHLEKERKEQDKDRDAFLNNLGICVLRFDNHQVKNQLSGVLEEIVSVMEAFEQRGCHRGRSEDLR